MVSQEGLRFVELMFEWPVILNKAAAGPVMFLV